MAVRQTLPDFIDNDGHKMAEALDFLLRSESVADIASGYFNLGGYSLVKEALNVVAKMRLLLSKEPGKFGTGELYPAGFRQDIANTRYAAQNRTLAEELVLFLLRPEVEVRLYTKGFFHGKAYIFQDVAIIGSSNFTYSGLTANTELNSVHKQGYAAHAARDWFERFWEQSEDYKLELIQLLEESKLISKGYPPYAIFIKSLYEYFKDELLVDLAEGRDIGKSLVDLADFQQKAYERALRILDKYDGVMVADSVGLGKTWIGKKLLEHFGYFQRKKCLVVAPAQLTEMWHNELLTIQVSAHVESMEVMGRPDFDPAPYFDCDVVLVDESHNFRNSNQRYAALSRIMSAGKRKKAILLTATPINNSVFDLYNQVMLFSRTDRTFAKAGIPYLRSYFIRALEDGDLLNLLEEVMVRRTRQFIKQEFPDAIINGETIRFPQRELHTERYDLETIKPGLFKEIGELFEKLDLAVYNPEGFLKRPTLEQELEQQRNQALIGLIKSLILKRFESSVLAFKLTLQRQIEFYELFIEELNLRKRLLSSQLFRQILVMDEDQIAEALDSLPRVDASAYKVVDLSRVVAEDLEILRSMFRLVEDIAIIEDPKILELVELLKAKKGKKIVVFSYFQDTIRYIAGALEGPFANMLEGWRWEIVDGGVHPHRRSAILRRFAPKSQKVEVKPENEIDLLLATDVLSEGQNLQDADTLINFDLHWNPTRMIQRAGRIDRLGSPFEEIHIHNFYPEDGLEELLGLVERLSEKIIQIDRNVGLDASILGEVINPKTFNALRRIEEEDLSIADELEAESELSSEFMRSVLSQYLQQMGRDKLENIPYGVHSGMEGKGRKGIFFHFKARGEHLWRFYDIEKRVLLDSKQRIFSLIHCTEGTPRADANYNVDQILIEVQNSLLDELNIQHAATVQELPKIQRDVLVELRGLARHPQVEREKLIDMLKILNQPLSRVLLRELERIHKVNSGVPVEFVGALEGFIERYGLEYLEEGDNSIKPYTVDDLDLVVYLNLA